MLHNPGEDHVSGNLALKLINRVDGSKFFPEIGFDGKIENWIKQGGETREDFSPNSACQPPIFDEALKGWRNFRVVKRPDIIKLVVLSYPKARLPGFFQDDLPVLLLAVAAVHRVVAGSRVLYSQRSCHWVRIASEGD